MTQPRDQRLVTEADISNPSSAAGLALKNAAQTWGKGDPGPYGGTSVTDPQVASFITSGLTTATAGDQRWMRKIGEVVSVKSYGAVGNGTTDDSSAVQAAVNAAGPGGTVVFPRSSGKYVINTVVTVPNDDVLLLGTGGTILAPNKGINITGDRYSVVGLHFEGAGNTAKYVPHTSPLTITGTPSKYISGVISDCSFVGLRDTGVWLHYVENFVVTRCIIDHFRYGGVMVNSGRNGSITFNRIAHSNIDTTVNLSYGVEITDLDITEATRSRDVLVAFNSVEDIPGWEGLDTHGGIRIAFLYNTVLDCRYGLVLGAGDPNRIYPPNQCSVIGNTVSTTLAIYTAGVNIGGALPEHVEGAKYADVIVRDNICTSTSAGTGVNLPGDRGLMVDRKASTFSGNKYNNLPDLADDVIVFDWVDFSTIGTFRTGFSSHPTYPLQIRKTVTPSGTKIQLKGGVSVSGATVGIFGDITDASYRPTIAQDVGLSRSMSSATFESGIVRISPNGNAAIQYTGVPSVAFIIVTGDM